MKITAIGISTVLCVQKLDEEESWSSEGPYTFDVREWDRAADEPGSPEVPVSEQWEVLVRVSNEWRPAMDADHALKLISDAPKLFTAAHVHTVSPWQTITTPQETPA
ncbi:hypothetical protein ACFVAJ_18400 [Agromyces sp. NPDC057679]|uniref:hypothetical protein n=1 Tax=Agromyces sp. NPDC057679 TaxID=3346207 RepID=UPI0036723174